MELEFKGRCPDCSGSGLGHTKASRDIASGAVILTLLTIGDHRAVAHTMLALTLIPILDGLVVFKHADWIFKPAILIHCGTAILMLIIVELLRSGM